HLDTFAWVGGFSSAPNTKSATELLKDPTDAAGKLRLLWLSCGKDDGLVNISQRFHDVLVEKKVPHIWHVEPGEHTMAVWKNDLYLFSQRLFRDGAAQAKADAVQLKPDTKQAKTDTPIASETIKVQPPVELTREQDHQRLRDLLA